MRIIGGLFLLLAIFSAVIFLFWQQEIQYLQPTPKPEGLTQIPLGKPVAVPNLPGLQTGKPVFIHFYNPDCPCSRFNVSEFHRMVRKYNEEVQFYGIIQTDEQQARQYYREELGVPVILDTKGAIADRYGIYSTPQALLIDTASNLFYKGNYNKARYCTSRNTRFAELAIQAQLNNEPLPEFHPLAYQAYGCQLPHQETETNTFASFQQLFKDNGLRRF